MRTSRITAMMIEAASTIPRGSNNSTVSKHHSIIHYCIKMHYGKCLIIVCLGNFMFSGQLGSVSYSVTMATYSLISSISRETALKTPES